MTKRIVIAGYFGFGNLGDEIILTAMVSDLRQHSPDLEIIAITGESKLLLEEMELRRIYWSQIDQITTEISSCDLVIIGGGGIFHDYWGTRQGTLLTSEHIGISFYASIMLVARNFNKKLMLYAVGVGPLFNDNSQELVYQIAKHANLITVRDKGSKQLLNSLGIQAEKIIVTADPAFSFENLLRSAPENIRYPESLTVGVCLRHWDLGLPPGELENKIASGIDKFLEVHSSARVVFIPFQSSDDPFLSDYSFSELVRRNLTNKDRARTLSSNKSYSKRITALLNCNVILGMRLHAILLALKNNKPIIGIQYDPKVKAATLGCLKSKQIIEISKLTEEAVYLSLENAVLELVNHSGNEKINIFGISNKARSTARLAINLLESKVTSSSASFAPFPRVLVRQLVETSAHLSQKEKLLEDSKNKQKLLVERFSKILLDEPLDPSTTQDYQDLLIQIQQKIIDLKTKNSSFINELSIEKKRTRNLEKKVVELQARIKSQESTFENDTNEITHQLHNKQKELGDIKGSHAWKLIWVMWRIRLFLFPRNSWRERILNHILGNDFKDKFKTIFRIRIRNVFFYSPYELIFKRFKYKRKRIFNRNLQGLTTSADSDLVSLVLPVFNGEKYIRECVESILEQTYSNFELIIVNDGSTDSTPLIIEELKKTDSRIQLIHQSNKKLPLALNAGFSKARGEFLTWISHDNRIKPDYLFFMVNRLKRHPKWDFIYTDMDLIDENGDPLLNSKWYAGYQVPYGSNHIRLPKNTLELNTWPNNYIGGAFLYRDRVKLLISGYSGNQFTREDYDYWMRVNSFLDIKHVTSSKSLYEYRIHTGSLTSRDEELAITSDRESLMRFEDFRRDFLLTPTIWYYQHDPSSELDYTLSRVLDLIISNHQLPINLFYSYDLNLMQRWSTTIFFAVSNEATTQTIPPSISQQSTKVLILDSGSDVQKINEKEWDLIAFLGTPPGGRKIPSNWLNSHRLEELMLSIDIRSRSTQLMRIEDRYFSHEKRDLDFSIIVCTYQREEVLEKLISSLAEQDYPHSKYEVLIVDNNSELTTTSLNIEQLCQQYFKDHPKQLRWLHFPIPGLSNARNIGISESRGNLLVFLDDDAVPSRDLLKEYHHAYRMNRDVGVIGGSIQLQKPEIMKFPFDSSLHKFWSELLPSQPGLHFVNHWWEYPWGANWSARYEALKSVGGFRNAYGRNKNDFNGGEEIIAASLIARTGYKIAILPSARVLHCVAEDRFSLEHLRKTIYSGLKVRYLAEQDLYIDSERSREGVLSSIFSRFNENRGKTKPITSNIYSPANIESFYYFLARMKLFILKIGDFFKRIKWLNI